MGQAGVLSAHLWQFVVRRFCWLINVLAPTQLVLIICLAFVIYLSNALIFGSLLVARPLALRDKDSSYHKVWAKLLLSQLRWLKQAETPPQIYTGKRSI